MIISLDAKILFLELRRLRAYILLSFRSSLLTPLRSSPPKCTCDHLLHLSLTFSFYDRTYNSQRDASIH
jgi:hypothetical protein